MRRHITQQPLPRGRASQREVSDSDQRARRRARNRSDVTHHPLVKEPTRMTTRQPRGIKNALSLHENIVVAQRQQPTGTSERILPHPLRAGR